MEDRNSKSPAKGSPSLEIPQEDLTRERFDSPQYRNLTDRQKLAWAYQTETRVRFAKLQGQYRTTTLDSEYLIDLYPDHTPHPAKFSSLMERDRHAFERKLLPCMQHEAAVDDSLTPIRMVGYDQDDNGLKPGREKDSKNRRIPPNLLFFEISMEAYMGYQWRGLNSEDPTVPRGAIIGGAVVAALSSWEFTQGTDLLRRLEEVLYDDSCEESKYIEVKKSVVKWLHEYFLHQPRGFEIR